MTSSKFNRTPVPRLRPPICIAPAGSCLPPFPNDDPIWLHGYVDWLDLDPLDPTEGSGYCFLEKVGPGRYYYGEAKFGPTGVAAECQHVGIGDLWDVTIYHLDDARPPYGHTWPNVLVDPNAPFDSGQLRTVTIPGQDTRACRILL